MADGDTKIVTVKFHNGFTGSSTVGPDEDEFEELNHMNKHSAEDDYIADQPAGYIEGTNTDE